MSIAVTGARGLIGREVIRQLTAAGRAVVGLDRESSDGVIGVDLRDAAGVRAALEEARVTSIIHCGGISGQMVEGPPRDIVDINVGGTANMLDAALALDVERFVFTSTAGVYAGGEEPMTEDACVSPWSMYGATKAAAESLVTGYRADQGLEAVSFRLSWVYGPYRTTDCFIRDLITQAQASGFVEVPYGRGFPRQFMHVEDTARLLITAHDHAGPTPSPFYNASGSEYTTLDQVAKVVAGAVPGAVIELADGPAPLDRVQGPIVTDRVAADLGFTPRVPLAAGVPAYAAWLAEQPEVPGDHS